FFCLGALGLLYYFRDAWVAPHLKSLLVSTVKRELGLDVAIGHLGGSYLSDLEIRQVRTLRAHAAGPLVFLNLDRLRLHYFLPALLLGQKTLGRDFTLELQGVRAGFLVKEQTNAGPFPAGSPKIKKNVFTWPSLPRLLMQDVVISVETPYLSLPELRLESQPAGDHQIRLRAASPRVELKSSDLRSRFFSLETEMVFTPEEIKIKRLNVVQAPGSNRLLLLAGVVPLEPILAGQWGQCLASAGGKFIIEVKDVSSWLTTTAQKPIHLPAHAFKLEGEISNGKLRIRPVVWEMAQGRFQLERFSADLEALTGSGRELPWEIKGTLQADDLAPWAQLLEISGIKGAGHIAWEGQGGLSDFTAQVQAGFLNVNYQPGESEDMAFHAGKLDFQIRLQGALPAPRLTGMLSLEAGQVKLWSDFPVMRDIRMNAKLDSSRAVIPSLEGTLGGSPFSLTGTVEDFLTGQPRFDLKLQGENLLWYRSDSLRLRADTQIAFQGPLAKINVSGIGKITDGLYSRDFDFLEILKSDGRPRTKPDIVLFSLFDPPFDQMQFRVRISSAAPILIKNNAAVGSLRPELFLSGTGEVPVLTGTVYLDPTTVALPTGSLAIPSGLVRFLETSPDIPRLDILGQAKMQGYDITLKITGPYDEPLIALSSVPPASHDQLLLLMLTGQSPQPAFGQRFVSTGNLALYLGHGVAGRFFGERGRGLLDRLQLNVGREISRDGAETLEAQFQIAENWLINRNKVYLISERDVYDDFNAGAKIVFQFK
ncbi:MAG: hypothetical protein HGA76_08635, partial [Candidatus Firestonebacteria bacterium]|nr:hypothetical protein [Candidatus Firestonebacteria bacterium]